MPDPEKAALMRSVNEGIALFAVGLEAGHPDVGDRWSFVCECGVPDCVEWVELDLAAYGAIRSHADGVVLASRHQTAALRGTAAPDLATAGCAVSVGQAAAANGRGTTDGCA